MRELLETILLRKDILSLQNEKALFEMIPELQRMVSFPHRHPHHHLDVWNHTLLALSFSEPDLEIRLALLLHDIGKVTCYQDEEVRHFHGHPLESKRVSIPILSRLGYDENTIERISFLISMHDTRLDKMEPLSPELSEKLLKIQYCDAF